MDWVTSKYVREHATTKRSAVRASRKHWKQLSTCTEQELRDHEGYPLSTGLCGLCIYYDDGVTMEDCTRSKRLCPLNDDGYSCCEDYSSAHDAYDIWTESGRERGFNEFQTLAQKLYKRLMNIKI